MFGLDELKKTRYFQEVTEEARQEGRQEVISKFLKSGLSVEQVAKVLDLSVEQVRQIATPPPN